MLHAFLKNRRSELITRWTLRVAKRLGPGPRPADVEWGIPFFLDELLSALQAEQAATLFDGREFLRRGFTATQVVYDCGNLREAITEVALERNAIIDLDEFRTLDRCLDNAIAAAVAECSFHENSTVADHTALRLEERRAALAFELRNRIRAATLALTAIKLGYVSPNGATAAVLDQSLIRLRSVIDHSLDEVRPTPPTQFSRAAVRNQN